MEDEACIWTDTVDVIERRIEFTESYLRSRNDKKKEIIFQSLI